MPIESSGEIRLRGTAGDGRTDINEEINSNATDTDVSLGTLNTSAFTNVSDGSTISGRSMSEMRGFALVTADPFYPTTEATGALGESLFIPQSSTISYLDRNTNFNSTGNTATYSIWLKRNDITGTNQTIIASGADQNNRVWLRFNTSGSVIDGKLQVVATTSSSTKIQLVYDYPFTDTGAWYHIIVAFDTTKSYQYDRVRVYANGIELTEIDGSVKTEIWPSQNDSLYFNDNQRIADVIWSSGIGSDIVFADFKFIDGQQLRPDSFGEMKNGIWVPKAYSPASTDTLVTSNLVANYQLNGDTTDETGNYNGGTVTNGTFYSNNYGIVDLTSTNSKVVLTNSNNFQGTDITMSWWVSMDSISTNPMISNYNGGSYAAGDFYVSYRSDLGGLLLQIHDGTGYQFVGKTESLKTNTWYHITYSKTSDTTGGKFYVNGIEASNHEIIQNSSSGSTILNTNDQLWIGNHLTSTSGFDGKFGELQIYTRQLTNAEILQNYNATKHKYAYGLNGFHLPLNNTNTGSIVSDTSLKLHLDASNSSSYGGSGTSWNDLSGNSNTATIYGSPNYLTTNGGYFDLDGSNDYIVFPGSTISHTSDQNFTIEAWLKFASVPTSGSHNFIGSTNSSNRSPVNAWFYGTGSGLAISLERYFNSTQYYSSGYNSNVIHPFVANKWYQIVITYNSNGKVVTIYVNGKQEDNSYTLNISNGSQGTTSYDMTIGNYSGTSFNNFDIAQFRIYNDVLTAQEVIQNYRATQGNYEQVSTVDISGNANSFTATNLDYTDHIKDQPAENYPALIAGSNTTLTEGALKAATGGNNSYFYTNTAIPSTGKWYFEVTKNSGDMAISFAMDNPGQGYGYLPGYGPSNTASTVTGWDGFTYFLYYTSGGSGTNRLTSTENVSGSTYVSATDAYTLAAPSGFGDDTNGTTYRFSIDQDNNTVDVIRGTDTSNAFTFTLPTAHQGKNWFVGYWVTTTWPSASFTYNFGQNPFVYTIPTNFKTLATHNLPNAQFDPKDSEQNKDYFKAVTYQGNGGTQGEAYGIVDGSKAGVFNGSSSRIDTAGLNSFFGQKQTYSVSLWFKSPSSATGNRTMFDDYNYSNQNIALYLYDGALVFFGRYNNNDFTFNTGSTTYNDDQWHHVVITSDQSTVNGYVDGVSFGSVAVPSASYSGGSPSVGIGRQQHPGSSTYGYFSGQIDQVRVFNRALLTNNNGVNEISELYDEQDLTATTRSTTDIFSDGSGVALYELNGDALDTGGVSGKFGNGAIFNGSSSKIDITNSSFNLTTYSISTWIYSSNYNQSNVTFFNNGLDSTGSQWGGLAFGVNANKVFYYGGDVTGVGGSGFFTQTGTTNLTNGAWTHVLMIVNGTSITGYINGTQDTGLSRTLGANIVYRATPQNTLGARAITGGTYGYFNGNIDQVRIFNSDVSASVSTIYNESGADLSTTDILGDGSGVALYQLDGDATDSSGTIAGTTVTLSGGSSSYAYANASASSGKYYWEVKVITNGYGSGSTLMAGIANTSTPSGGWQSGNNYFYYASNGYKYSNGSSSAYGGTWQQGYVIGVALDLDNDTLTFYRNNTSQGQAYSGLNGSYYPSFATGLYADEAQFIFDSNDWTYSAPSGYSEWTAAKTASIVTGNGATTSQITYDGTETNISYAYNGTASNVTYTQDKPYGNIDLGFAPDLVWAKCRSLGYSNVLIDSVKGSNSSLYSDLTTAEDTSNIYISSLDSNGFSLTSTAGLNASGQDFVAWSWKAGGAASTYNIDGTGYATRSAAGLTSGTIADSKFLGCSTNTETGFSIIHYNGSGGSAGQTIDTGLTSNIELMIVKRLDSTGNWIVIDSHTNKYHFLNTTAAGTSATFTDYVDGTKPKLYDFAEYIHYCWHSVDGFSKIGSYIGNGSANGPFVYTGFKPAWVMIKRTDTTGHSWLIYDNARDTVNNVGKILYANSSQVENPIGNRMSFNSNGFKLETDNTSHNANGGTYIYMAFAEDPFTTSNGVATLGDGNEFIEGGNYPEDNFNTTLYTGDGSTSLTVDGGFNFTPDAIWIKNRSAGSNHILQNTIIGINAPEYPDATYVGGANSSFGHVNSVSKGSFNVDDGGGTENNANYNGNNYVAWSWKAAGNENTYNILENGTITSSASASALGLNIGSVTPDAISANRDNGFSIIKYTGPNGAATIDHGLSKPPEIYIIKNTTNTDNWRVYHKDVGGTKYLNLDDGSSATTASTVFNNSDPTSKIFNIGTAGSVSENNSIFTVYAWHSVPGFSKIGSYLGTSTTNFLYLGFEPAWLMVKRTTNTTTDGWMIYDNNRGNADLKLAADSSSSEYASRDDLDFETDGVTFKGSYGLSNGSGQTYIYMAFAHR